MALLAAIFFGFVPMFLFAAFVNWLDRYEKEPKVLLGAAFVWGVVIAGGGAYILNTVFGIGIYVLTSSTARSPRWASPPSRTCCTSTATGIKRAAGRAFGSSWSCA